MVDKCASAQFDWAENRWRIIPSTKLSILNTILDFKIFQMNHIVIARFIKRRIPFKVKPPLMIYFE